MQDIQNQLSILQTLEKHPTYSQRTLAAQMSMSLGKVNYCLKGLIEKGYIKAESFRQSPCKIRYAYLLTPEGVREKSKLTLCFLQRKTQEYERLKVEIEQLQQQVKEL